MSIVPGSDGPGICTQVTPAASKSAPTVKEQLQRKPPEEQLQRRTTNDAGTHLKRLVSGEIKASESLKDEASAALSIFKQLSDCLLYTSQSPRD